MFSLILCVITWSSSWDYPQVKKNTGLLDESTNLFSQNSVTTHTEWTKKCWEYNTEVISKIYLITTPTSPFSTKHHLLEVTRGCSPLSFFLLTSSVCAQPQTKTQPATAQRRWYRKYIQDIEYNDYLLYIQRKYISYCTYISYRETSVIRRLCCHLPRSSVESSSMTTCTTQLSAQFPSLLCPTHQKQTLWPMTHYTAIISSVQVPYEDASSSKYNLRKLIISDTWILTDFGTETFFVMSVNPKGKFSTRFNESHVLLGFS